MKLLNGIDYGVIILYNVILIAVGVYLAKKKVKKASDFTTASQSLGTFTVAGSIISTCMGASVLFSNYQLVHAGGIRAAITSAFWYGAWLILVLLVGRIRKTGASSIPDYISKRFSNSSMSMSLFFSYLVSSSLNVACEPSYSKYSLAAKDAKSAVRGQLIAWAVCTCVWLISTIPPLWINQIFPDMTDGSLFVTRLVATYLPVGVRGMIIAVVLSLLITTGNSFLLLLTSSITDDVIRPMKPDLSDKSLLRISRIVIAGGAALIALIAIVVPDIATAFKIGGNAFGPVVAVPVLLSFFWKGVNEKATSIAMILSVIVSVCLDIYFIYVVGVGAIGNMYAVVVSLIINIFGSIYFNAKQKKAAA